MLTLPRYVKESLICKKHIHPFFIIEFGLSCEYNRRRKKRGKASRKSIIESPSTTPFGPGSASNSQDLQSEGPSPSQAVSGYLSQSQDQHSLNVHDRPNTITVPSISHIDDRNYQKSTLRSSIANEKDVRDRLLPRTLDPAMDFSSTQQKLPQIDPGPLLPREHSIVNPSAAPFNGFSLGHLHERSGSYGSKPRENRSSHSGSIVSQTSGQQAHLPGFHDTVGDHFAATSPNFRIGSIGASPFPGVFNSASPIVGSPGWLNLPSPATFQHKTKLETPSRLLRYPVLQPVLPYIESVIPISLACDLLELYFASSSTTYLHPYSPYVLGYMFRKQSFLTTQRPRACSPALLASILWLAAQTSDSSFLTSSPSARGRACQKLMEITVKLLKPLMHGPQIGEASAEGTAISRVTGAALGGLGVSMSGDQLTVESEGARLLDTVATYIHLASIVAASEYKAASMRYWGAAFGFAREIRLNRELPDNSTEPEHLHNTEHSMDDAAAGSRFGDSVGPMDNTTDPSHSLRSYANQEEREERRRVWWLLFFMDRHLSLCYNQPLRLLDAECENLFQPLSEIDWQAGNWPSDSAETRLRGPRLLCTGHGVFGFFMPLMTILGEIVDLNHTRAHPRYARLSTHTTEWDEREANIKSRLQEYDHSLRDFELEANAANDATNNTQSPIQAQPPGGRKMSDAAIQTKIVVAYGTHIMHVLYILATGKWDPIDLLDDKDSWISTPSFISAMGHAVSAADAVADILEYDPDLSYMPWLFGISLLQGSFLLLLIADKLGSEADTTIVTACEKIVRAHEVCVVTLNTEYQVRSKLFIPSYYSMRVTQANSPMLSDTCGK